MDYLQQIETAVGYIEKNLEKDLTVAAVANSAAYSYYHFHRGFEAVVGESIGSYIRSRRLSKAAIALLETDNRIIDIALSLRFESHEAFSRAFKLMFHITPSQYRKNGVNTIIGRKNPLNGFSLHHRKNLSLEPEIVMLPKMYLAGMRFPVSIENNTVADKWPVFIEGMPEISNIIQPTHRYCFYEAHENCTYDTLDSQVLTTAFIGVEVAPTEKLSGEMVLKYFEGGKYAHFVHIGTTASLLDTYRYIWGTWIPYNKVALAPRDDIELFIDGERFLGIDNGQSRSDIFLPVL